MSRTYDSHRPPYSRRSPNCRPSYLDNFRIYRPPDRSRPANFIIELRPGFNASVEKRRAAVEGLIADCKAPPDSHFIPDHGKVPARLFFTQWTCTLEFMVRIWESRFSGKHDFVPKLIPNVRVPSDIDELNDRLKTVFSDKLRGLIAGELVNKWEKKIQGIESEICAVCVDMKKRRTSLLKFQELSNTKKALISEKNLIVKRIAEFNGAMKCVLRHIERGGKRYGEDTEDWGWIPPFRLRDGLNWPRIYCIVKRECRRLDDGLPIYAFRQEIFRLVSSQQILVLIGETGSGKSTQLMQFLADSGVVGSGTVVCTQPRRIAAISLAKRVQEESYQSVEEESIQKVEESFGCYENDNSICYCPSYSSQQFKDRLVYMTDHCLLQHFIYDRNLNSVSCIIVDEAHERSLNTDLLLALLKNLLPPRPDLRLIIMSATADAKQLSDYFFGCGMFKVVGRNFPVDVKYMPCVSEGTTQSLMFSPNNEVAPYLSDVVKAVTEIHRSEEEGTILAFLTSQREVEWASTWFQAPNAIPLALHGKLSREEQSLVFHDYPGKRKVIFATNVAETSLTIPGVKYVVDSGLAKESRFEAGSGMNVLRVCWISKSSANQRAGRAGRTEPGRCYRLYSHEDFCSMADHQEPEIRRVHLGVAVLKIITLGVESVQDFDFVDSPSLKAIDMAIENLTQLGAITMINGEIKLTATGRNLVKLGIEPRLGKLILGCFNERLGKEGVVLAAVMANSSNIFCRVGNLAGKLKSDRLKVPFCHCDGDLFTLLSVYKEWEKLSPERRNKWCWDNSINAKSMRRCHDMVLELNKCLQNELHMIVPSYWSWKAEEKTVHDRNLKKAILAALAENVAMYSGSDQLGYKVALTGQYVLLHPSCSLLIFNHKPEWVVFGEILSASDQYMVCVTAFDRELLSTLDAPRFSASEMESQMLQVMKLSGFGKTLLKKFCGKSCNALLSLVSRIRKMCDSERIFIEVDVDNSEIRLLSLPQNTEKVLDYVKRALDCERRWLQNECMEICLYHGGPGICPPVALLGSGAEIKHIEIHKRSLTVDVFASKVGDIDDKELLLFIESHVSGICAVHKSTAYGRESEEKEKWGSLTFMTPDSAKRVVDELNNTEFNGSVLQLNISGTTFGVDKAFSFPAVKAKLSWPRRFSKGFAIVKCDAHEVGLMLLHFSNLQIGERYIRCEPSTKYSDSIVISGIDKEASEHEVLQVLRSATYCRIRDFFLVRGAAVDNPPCRACEEALFREISVFMPKGRPQINFCRVQVFSPEPKDAFMRAMVTFDGRLHLEAAKALEQIEGKVLPDFLSWQKIQCQRLFHTSVSCPAFIYSVIGRELDSLVFRCNSQSGIECIIDRNANGSCRVRISATATKTVAELRRPFEELIKGRIVTHASLSPSSLQLLFSRDGVSLMRSLHLEMGIHVLFDKQNLNVRLFGPSDKIPMAEEMFIQRFLSLHENKELEIHLRGPTLSRDLMKEVVKRFGPDLLGLRDQVTEAELTLNIRRHVIYIRGTKDAKQKVEEIVREIAQESRSDYSTDVPINGEMTCPICLCEVENGYQLENCLHIFCRSCLVEQCESAIKNIDSFPICCTHAGCAMPFWPVDLKSLLQPGEKLDELFVASIRAFVASSGGSYRFCPSPDCPSVYRVAGADDTGEPFVCGACYSETCTRCHVEYHPFLSCEKYKEYKEDPDLSLKEWSRGKEDHVKSCPVCGYTIEKAEGCNHVECKCGAHICWVCLDHFTSSDDCYNHLRAIHQGIT